MPSFYMHKKEGNYFHSYKDSENKGFRADIILNPRDAMVFAEIKSLPESPSDQVEIIDEFVAFFKKNYGAKSLLTIKPNLLPQGHHLKAGAFDARYMGIDKTNESIQTIHNKPHVALQLEKFETGEYQLLTKEDLRTRTKELSEFKIKYASFIDKTKIERGQYSEKAEEEKLNNPFNEHYAVLHNGKIVACVMQTLHGGDLDEGDFAYTYDADFIVHPDYRSKDKEHPVGLGQAMCIKVHEHMSANYPVLAGSWLIAGGYGKEGVGAHLYDAVFPTDYLKDNPALQTQLGFYLMFGSPGPEFCAAANRDPVTQCVKDEDQYIQAALLALQQSPERNLTAAQPKSLQQIKQESITSLSVFHHGNKIPTRTQEIDLRCRPMMP